MTIENVVILFYVYYLFLTKGYLVYSDNCKIPSIDPYVSEVMYEFRRNRNEPCTRNLPITSIQYNHTTRHYTLSYNYTTLNAYKINPHLLDCCYKVITRKLSSTLPDFYTMYVLYIYNRTIKIFNISILSSLSGHTF